MAIGCNAGENGCDRMDIGLFFVIIARFKNESTVFEQKGLGLNAGCVNFATITNLHD